MAYEVGVGYLDLVPSLGGNFNRILQGAGSDIQRTLGRAGQQGGEDAGNLFSGSFGKILKAGAIVGAVVAAGKAAGAAFTATFGEAIERQASTDKLAAQLGISESDSKALGATAGKLYAQAYGESFQGVTDAIGVVKSSLKNLDAGQLEEATKKALSFSQAFGVDMSRSVQSVSTLIGSGLVKDSTEAFDVLTKVSQKVPAALREDVLDASDEYSQFFRALGFNGAQAFGALAKGSEKGVFGIDKTGDAIKEFTIRATDMSATSVAAFNTIGLDAQTMANDLLAGGDTAQTATQKIIGGLLNIQDPATRANTALALFGTPLEDLGVANIPTFLSSLQDATGGLGDFAGAADAVDEKLSGTLQSKWTSLTRTIEGFGPTISSALLPVFGPVLDGLTNIASIGQEKLQKASERITGFMKDLETQVQGPLQRAQGYFSDFWGSLTTGFSGGAGPLGEIGATLHDTFGDTFKQLMDTGKQVFDAIGPPLIEAFKTIWDAVQPLIPTFLQLFQAFNPVGLLFDALLPVLPQLAAVFGDLAKTLAGGIARTLEVLQPLFQKVVDVINRLLPFITKLIESLLPPLVNLFEKIAPLLDSILGALLPLISNIIDSLIPAIDAIMPVVERVFTFIANSIGNVINVFSGIIDFITGVFSGDWSKAWEGIKEIFGAIWDQIKNIVSLVWDGISAILRGAWENAIKPVFDAIGAGASAVGSFFSGLWDTVQNVWQWIQDKISGVWNWINQYVFGPLTTGVSTIGTFFSNLWTTAQNVWQWIQDKISGVWNWLNQYVFAPMGLGINTIGTFFGNLWQTVENIWGKISGFFSKVAEGISNAVGTVKTAIENVKKLIENFISGEWIQGSSHLGNLDVGNGLWGNIGGGARGAVVPGDDPGRRDNVLGMLPSGAFFGLRSEEAVMVPEFTHAVGGEPGVNRLNRLAESGRIGEIMQLDGFARGGVAGRAHDMLAVPALAILKKIFPGVESALQLFGIAPAASASPGGSGVERWRPLGLSVLQRVGAYVGKNLLPFIGNMMLQIGTESGGDPNAINLTDINAQRGDPSIGLLQVIRSTFVAALSGTPFAYLIARGQRDPEASMTASTLYSLNRYGSLDRAWRGVAYYKGGITPDWGGGIDSVPAWLTPGEGVFTPPETKAIITHAKALEAGYAGQVPALVINLDSSDPLQVAVGQMIRASWAQASERVSSVGAMS